MEYNLHLTPRPSSSLFAPRFSLFDRSSGLLQGFNDLVAVERTRQALKVSRNVAALNDEGGGWMRGGGMVRCGARHGKTWEHATGLYGGYFRISRSSKFRR